MKSENSRTFYLFLIILGILVGFVYIKWDDFVDLVNNLVNYRESHPNTESITSFEEFSENLKKGLITKVDVYENGKIAIYDIVDNLGQSKHLGINVPINPSSFIIQLRESKVDFTSHPSVSFDSAWSILGALLVPLLVLGVPYLILRFLISQTGNSDFFSNLTNQFMNVRKARAKVQLDAETGVLFADVAGIDEAKQEFEEFVTFLKMPQLFTAVGANPPKGVIIVGPPGTGKTLLAKAIAGEAGVPFISISGSEFVEMFVGIGASRVRDLFETAEQNSPCILFIDEFDSIAIENERTLEYINQMLVELDGVKDSANEGLLVIAATNRLDKITPSIIRPGRFDRHIYFGLPDASEREALIKVLLRKYHVHSKIDVDDLINRTRGWEPAKINTLFNKC